MKTQQKSVHKKLIRALVIVLLLLAILAGVFFWYVSDYYRAEDVALEVLAQNDGIVTQDNLTILSPSYQSDTAIIFYPGAKVEAEAYLPLLDQIRQTGITCILVDMPFHMAIFDSDAAEDVMTQFPEIEHWYLAGHSMGGAMASKFAAEHPDEVDGLILMGAYIYGDYPDEDTLTIYGSLNQSVEDTSTIPKILWRSKAEITRSLEIMVCKRVILRRKFPQKSSRNKQWKQLRPFWKSAIQQIHKEKKERSVCFMSTLCSF